MSLKSKLASTLLVAALTATPFAAAAQQTNDCDSNQDEDCVPGVIALGSLPALGTGASVAAGTAGVLALFLGASIAASNSDDDDSDTGGTATPDT